MSTLSQFSHSKRFPLSCDIWWRMRLDFQLKAFGHWSHLYSLSSVCTTICWPRLRKHIKNIDNFSGILILRQHIYVYIRVGSITQFKVSKVSKLVPDTDLYSLGKIFSQSLHSCTGSSLSSRSCLRSSLNESKIELPVLQEYFWCCRNSSFDEKSSSQSSQRYICSSESDRTSKI